MKRYSSKLRRIDINNKKKEKINLRCLLSMSTLSQQSGEMKWNESGFRPEDGEMIGMTLPSRHRIRDSSPGGLRPSTLPLGHRGSPQYWLSHVDGKPPRPGAEPRTLVWKAAVLTTTLGPPPSNHEALVQWWVKYNLPSAMTSHH